MLNFYIRQSFSLIIWNIKNFNKISLHQRDTYFTNHSLNEAFKQSEKQMNKVWIFIAHGFLQVGESINEMTCVYVCVLFRLFVGKEDYNRLLLKISVLYACVRDQK